jgi:hypothetical protein
MVGHIRVVPNAAGLVMQDVLDHYQKAEKEQDSKQKPLARSLLQFAAVHGRTRRSGQHHRWKIWPIRVTRWLSNASVRLGLRDADTMGICS